jgi:hypothetical protein
MREVDVEKISNQSEMQQQKQIFHVEGSQLEKGQSLQQDVAPEKMNETQLLRAHLFRFKNQKNNHRLKNYPLPPPPSTSTCSDEDGNPRSEYEHGDSRLIYFEGSVRLDSSS